MLRSVGGQANLCQHLEEAASADKVEGLSQINEGDVKRFPLLSAFVLQLSRVEYHVDGGPLASESALQLGVNPFCKCLESLQDNSSEEFSHDTEQRDPAVVVTVASVTLCSCRE